VIVLGLQEDFAKYSYATDEIQDNIKKLLSSLRDVPLKKAKWCLGTLFDSVKSMVNSLEVFLRVAFEGETIDDQEEDNLMKAFRAYTMQFCLDYFQVNTWNERLSNEIINVIEMLIRSQSCFEERLAVLEQLFRHLSSINDQSTGIISSVVINSLAKNELQTISSSQAEVPFAATNDLEVVQILLKLMHSDDTNVGSLIAQELSKVNTVHVVLGLLQQGRASSQLKIDVLQLVALVIEKSFNNVEWIRDYTLSLFVQCLMEFSSSVSTQASIVLEILLDANPICGKKLVWILLGHGIKTCNDSTLYYEKNMWKTAACVANFIKYILDLCENMVDPVVKFLEEKLFFRKHGSTFINPFVLVVIKNLTQVKLSPRCINMFQLAIFPLNHDISNQERAFICTLQLEILKALCYLVRQSAPENELVGPYKQLICSEKLQHELQALSLGSCRVDSILAGSILGLVKEIAVGGKNEK
jgi:hypothetical protein